ncbi:hypothetical protein OSTOST_14809 [Ostertagia ostertagi]
MVWILALAGVLSFAVRVTIRARRGGIHLSVFVIRSFMAMRIASAVYAQVPMGLQYVLPVGIALSGSGHNHLRVSCFIRRSHSTHSLFCVCCLRESKSCKEKEAIIPTNYLSGHNWNVINI